MPTISDLIQSAEADRKSAERRLADTKTAIKRWTSSLEAAGVTDATASPEQHARGDQLVREHREATDAIKDAEGKLKGLRAVGDEEAESDRAARDVRPTGVVRYPDARDDDRPHALTRSQSMKDWARREGLLGGLMQPEGLSFDKMIRGIATGDWRGAEQEQRAISESPLTAGGHMVPTPLALEVIDKARNKARTLQAGITTVPMSSQTLKYPRLATEATPAWRTEGAAITDQAMTFESVTLTAQSMAMLVKVSWELFEDADEADGVVTESFAQQIALELDRVVLRGSGTAPEPRGIRNQTGVTLTSHGANGAVIGTGAGEISYDTLVDAQAAIRAVNFEPNAVIDAPRTEQGLAKLKDSTGQYLQPPPGLLTRYPTNQVPIGLTVGTSNDTSEIYTAQWDQGLLGIRSGLTIQFLSERFADNGQFAFLAHLRGDVQLAQPGAFVVDLGVRG